MKNHTPKTIYWTTWIAIYLVCLALPVLWLVCGGPRLGDFNMILVTPAIILPPLMAALQLRRLGLSKAGREVEIIARGAAIVPEENYPPLELRNPPAIYLGLALLFSVLLLGIVALLVGIPNATGKIYGVGMAVFFAVVALGCWIAYFRQAGFVARVDAVGVAGKAGLSVRKLKWTQIASCEVARNYDVFGNQVITTFDFKGETGYTLLQLTTDGAEIEQIENFKDAISHHLST